MPGWKTTTDLTTAMFNNYIGEVDIEPKSMYAAVYNTLYGKTVPTVRMFYYGERDENLSKIFGYKWEEK